MKSKMTTILEFKTCNAKLVDGQFVEIYFRGNEEYSVADITLLTDTILEFMEGKQFVSLIDFSQYFGSFSIEAKKYLSKHKGLEKYKYQEAFVIHKLGMRIQFNFYLKLNPSMRIKVFKDKNKAIDWLLKQREDILLK